MNGYRVVLLILAALVGACSPSVRNTTFLPQLPPARPDDHPIRVYYSRLPECEYEEIGLVTSSRPSQFVSMEQVRAALIAEARRMGGDAVVNLNEQSVVSGGGEYIDADRALQGTVVRFTDAACEEPNSPVAGGA